MFRLGSLIPVAVLMAACGSSTASPATSSPLPASPSPTTAASSAPAPPSPVALQVRVTDSTYGHVAATTTAGASCTASATLPSGNMSTAAGLQTTQTADGAGAVAWAYRTTSNTHKGTGTHTVNCTLNGQNATGSAPFTV